MKRKTRKTRKTKTSNKNKLAGELARMFNTLELTEWEVDALFDIVIRTDECCLLYLHRLISEYMEVI